MHINIWLKYLCLALLHCIFFQVAVASDVVPLANAVPQFPVSSRVPTLVFPAYIKDPNAWPKPDYFSKTLQLSLMRPDERVSSLTLHSDYPTDDIQYLILPTQTQALGFSQAFRAVVSAHAEWLFANAKLRISHVTELTDAYGPFVRRIDDVTLEAFTRQYPQKKVVAVYLGKDAFKHTFITLVIRDKGKTLQSHQTIDSSDDPVQALENIAKVLPSLMSAIGIPISNDVAVEDANKTCKKNTWDLALKSPLGNGLQRACYALAMGSLLPVYQLPDQFTDGLSSPARLAWLAEAYVQALRLPASVDDARAIRILAIDQLGFATPEATASFIPSKDPVVSRVAKLLSKTSQGSQAPVRNTMDSAKKYLKDITEDLPIFTQALFIERLSCGSHCRQINLCEIESAYPGVLMRTKCPDNRMAGLKSMSHTASNGETVLYQDWRLASYYNDILYSGEMLSDARGLQEIINNLPPDVASHPFVQQAQFAMRDKIKVTESATELLSRMKRDVRLYLQSIANVQKTTTWTARYSLTGHTWTSNFALAQDPQIVTMKNAEAQMLGVLSSDSFISPPSAPIEKLSATQIEVTEERHKSNVLSFFPRDYIDELPVAASFLDEMAKRPTDMSPRKDLAFFRLKEGGSIKDAIKLIEEYPKSDRTDNGIAQSYYWGMAANAFYLSGELDVAKQFYQRTELFGSGSESELMATARINLINGNLSKALEATESQLDRYETDFSRRDLASLLFITKQPDKAWEVILPRLDSANDFAVWSAALVGHRMEGASLAQVKDWMTTKKLGTSRIIYEDANAQYMHLYAILDRVPTDADLNILQEIGRNGVGDKRWAVSAQLIRSALEITDEQKTYQLAISSLDRNNQNRNHFMMPFFAWVAWQATNGKDPELNIFRQMNLHEEFGHVLSKSIVLALDGNQKDSLRYFRAARFELSSLTRRNIVFSNLPIPAPYQYAVSGYLMYKKTGDKIYRDDTLRFLRAYQKIYPAMGWLYSLEAVLEPGKKSKIIAACRAQYLDQKSYFLKLAKVDLPNQASCKSPFNR